MSISDQMIARVLSLSAIAAAMGAFFLLRPPGVIGGCPVCLDSAILGAVAAACGFLALAYSRSLDRPERWVCRLIAVMAILVGLFHASLVLPMRVLYRA